MILGKSNRTSSQNEFENYNFAISTEACGYTEIISDATEELAALESALFVADVMLEEKALEGTTPEEMDVLLEGVMSSLYTRLKEVLKKLIAKIKQWFANVKKFFQVLFSHGKEFAKKYKSDIVKAHARAKGFKYKTYNFKGGWKDLLETGEIQKVSGEVGAQDPLNKADALLSQNPNETSTSELVKKHMGKAWGNGIDSQAEFNKEFKEELYGGSMEKEEFEDFSSGPSLQDMLAVLEQGSKVLTNMDKIERALTSNCDKAVKHLEKAENNAAKAVKEGESLSKRYSLAVEICKAETNLALSIADIYKEALKVAMKDAESILKSLLRHKPVKEGFEGYEDDRAESILESAFKNL